VIHVSESRWNTRGHWIAATIEEPEWKWEEIGMNFIVGLARTQAGYDSIWVIVDRLTKVAYFILVKMTYSGVT
jgi:hypothetical protein